MLTSWLGQIWVGGLTGTAGEKRATAYVAAYLESLGFEPAGENGTFFHSFDFPAGSTLTDANQMTVSGEKLELNKDWQPLAFSKEGKTAETGIVFAGYGMQIPCERWDCRVRQLRASCCRWSVGHGPCVICLRTSPPSNAKRWRGTVRHGRKASIARDLGAKGIIFVTGPTSKVKNQLIRFDQGSLSGKCQHQCRFCDECCSRTRSFGLQDQDLAKSQKQLDDGSLHLGFPLQNAKASATVGIERKRGDRPQRRCSDECRRANRTTMHLC